jgi:hypothetical protein
MNYPVHNYMPINPAFHRFPQEASLIGRLLAAFGELEISVCYNTSKATGLGDTALCALYRVRATSARIDAADALMRPAYEMVGLSETYRDAIDRVNFCRIIRNQFAHCNWADHEVGGLFFADLQRSAATPDFWLRWKHIDIALLQSHEAYFDGALEALRFADHELAVSQGKLRSHVWPKPPRLAQPPLHNPEAQHIPPWLEPDVQARYLARLQELESGTQTPAHIAMELAREAARARRQADRDRNLKGRSDPESQQERRVRRGNLPLALQLRF